MAWWMEFTGTMFDTSKLGLVIKNDIWCLQMSRFYWVVGGYKEMLLPNKIGIKPTKIGKRFAQLSECLKKHKFHSSENGLPKRFWVCLISWVKKLRIKISCFRTSVSLLEYGPIDWVPTPQRACLACTSACRQAGTIWGREEGENPAKIPSPRVAGMIFMNDKQWIVVISGWLMVIKGD